MDMDYGAVNVYKLACEEIASMINTASTNPKQNWNMEAVTDLAQKMGDVANEAVAKGRQNG